LRQRNGIGQVRLKIGGSCGPIDEPFVSQQKSRLENAGLLHDVEFHPNLDRDAKIDFLKSLSVLSVPARYGEVFGLYLAEAWAAGIPVVQPRAAAFPELIKLSGAGLLCEPENPTSLADALETVLADDARRQQMSTAALAASRQTFNVDTMMRETLSVLDELRK
jgi:glycosyltransferase involved in cell wall biosynthesis